jgi:hypothetical protein
MRFNRWSATNSVNSPATCFKQAPEKWADAAWAVVVAVWAALAREHPGRHLRNPPFLHWARPPGFALFYSLPWRFQKNMTIAIHRHAYRLLSGSKGLIVEFVNSVDLSEFAWPITRVPMRATI